MSLSNKSSAEDLESIEDPSGLSSNDEDDSESSETGVYTQHHISFDTLVIDTVIRDKNLRDLIESTDIPSEDLFGLKMLYMLNNLRTLKTRSEATSHFFPEIYRLKDTFDIEESLIIKYLYDKDRGIPSILKSTNSSLELSKKGQDKYVDGKWIVERLSAEQLREWFKNQITVKEEQEDFPPLSLDGIKKKLFDNIKLEIDRYFKEQQKKNFLENNVELDNQFRIYLSEVLEIPLENITNPWGKHKIRGKTHFSALTTAIGKIGVLPNLIREYLESIDKKENRTLYLRYGSIGDGDCLFHSYLDLTNKHYFQIPPNSKGIRQKQSVMRNLRYWLQNNCSKYDYDYINPQISRAEGHGKNYSYRDYIDHLGTITDWGFDLDIIYIMNSIEYRHKQIRDNLEKKIIKIQHKIDNDPEKKDKYLKKKTHVEEEIIKLDKEHLYQSYNTYLFHFDPDHIVLPEEEAQMAEYGKRFIHLLDHYQYDERRKNIFIFNKEGQHYESIFKIDIPEGKPKFKDWLRKKEKLAEEGNKDGKLLTIKKKKKNNKKTKKKSSNPDKIIMDRDYLIDNHELLFQYNSGEDLIQNLSAHIKSSGIDQLSWQNGSIRNWFNSDEYTCGKEEGEYKTSDGYTVPNYRGVCPTDNPWRFKMGNTDNFCCVDTEQKAIDANKDYVEEDEYQDASGRKLPLFTKIDNEILTSQTYENINKRKTKSKKYKRPSLDDDIELIALRIELEEENTKREKRGDKIKMPKSFEYYKDKPWVKDLIKEGYLEENGSNFEKFDIYYQFCCKKMHSYEEVTEAMKEKFQNPETDSESSSEKLSSSSEESSEESSSSEKKSDKINEDILIKYLSGVKYFTEKYDKENIEKFIEKKYSQSKDYLINILNNPNGYVGCSDITEVIECINKNPEVTSIQLDNNDMTLIDEEISEMEYAAFCKGIINIENKDLEKFIDIEDKQHIRGKIHKDVPITGNKFRIYYGNICNQSLANGMDLENVLSIYMYPKDDSHNIKRIAVCDDFSIVQKSRNKEIEYKNIYFLGEGNDYEEIKSFFNNGIWKEDPDQHMGGSRKKKTKKKSDILLMKSHKKYRKKNTKKKYRGGM